MANYSNQTFKNQAVILDGNRYTLCKFINATLIYQGGELPQFDRCTFQGVTIELRGAAYQTIKYMNGLYRGGVKAPVDEMLEGVRAGLFPPNRRALPPTAEATGVNFSQLGLVSFIAIAVTASIILMMWYGWVWHPEQNILDGPVTQPLSEEIPLEVMPRLPDTLAEAYDLLDDEQAALLLRFGWVEPENLVARIPLENAIDILAQEGALPVRDEAGG